MRTNKYGVRGLKGVKLKRGFVYFWVPPVSLQRVGIFKHKTLGADFETAAAKARGWNAELEAYRLSVNGIRPTLTIVNADTVGSLVRQFEVSARFARYSPRTQQDYGWMYRAVEVQCVNSNRLFGEMKIPDDLQIRDLRRTAATEGASAGATPAEMMAVGGWANSVSIRPYLVQTREQAAAFQAKRDVYRSRSLPPLA